MARKTVNMQSIADETGFSIATVSLALRGVSRISAATRKKICTVAAKRGYQVSPLLSKAFAFSRRAQGSRYLETMAMILEYPMNRCPAYQKSIFEHAQNRAEGLGYRLDSFQVSGKASDHRHLSRVLRSRGIRGLVILPRVGTRFPRLRLEWQHFVAVEIGRTLWEPLNLHRVDRSIYHELIESFHLLKKAGYQRIGMAVEPTADLKRQGLFTAAGLIAQSRVPTRDVIPPLSRFGPWEERSFRLWFKKYRPEVVIIHATTEVPGWIKGLNLKIPDDVSIFGCNVEESKFSGLTSNLKLYGERSVELLSVLLERNEIGPRGEPDCWLVRGQWKEGQSLSRPLDFHNLQARPKSRESFA